MSQKFINRYSTTDRSDLSFLRHTYYMTRLCTWCGYCMLLVVYQDRGCVKYGRFSCKVISTFWNCLKGTDNGEGEEWFTFFPACTLGLCKCCYSIRWLMGFKRSVVEINTYFWCDHRSRLRNFVSY